MYFPVTVCILHCHLEQIFSICMFSMQLNHKFGSFIGKLEGLFFKQIGFFYILIAEWKVSGFGSVLEMQWQHNNRDSYMQVRVHVNSLRNIVQHTHRLTPNTHVVHSHLSIVRPTLHGPPFATYYNTHTLIPNTHVVHSRQLLSNVRPISHGSPSVWTDPIIVHCEQSPQEVWPAEENKCTSRKHL